MGQKNRSKLAINYIYYLDPWAFLLDMSFVLNSLLLGLYCQGGMNFPITVLSQEWVHRYFKNNYRSDVEKRHLGE